MRRILQIESRLGSTGGNVGDTLRQCVMRIEEHDADLEDLRARMREQDWYHDLSERESDEEIQNARSC